MVAVFAGLNRAGETAEPFVWEWARAWQRVNEWLALTDGRAPSCCDATERARRALISSSDQTGSSRWDTCTPPWGARRHARSVSSSDRRDLVDPEPDERWVFCGKMSHSEAFFGWFAAWRQEWNDAAAADIPASRFFLWHSWSPPGWTEFFRWLLVFKCLSGALTRFVSSSRSAIIPGDNSRWSRDLRLLWQK